jgi:hypothetical protein
MIAVKYHSIPMHNVLLNSRRAGNCIASFQKFTIEAWGW